MTWVDEIIQTLSSLNGMAPYSEIYKHIEMHSARKLTAEWKASVRRTIEDHASQSANFRGEDIFYSVNGLGGGVWGLRSMLPRTPEASDLEEPSTPLTQDILLSRKIRDTTLTKQLKQLYNHKCQICGLTLLLPGQYYSEAHHMKPLGSPHHGPDVIGNVVILCPNHHAEFDFGAIAVDPSNYEIMHIQSDNAWRGREIYINPNHKLASQYLEYHLSKIYDLSPRDASR